MDYQLWVIAREAEERFQAAGVDTAEAWAGVEAAEVALSEAVRAHDIALGAEVAAQVEWLAARETAETAYVSSCEHAIALGC
jgi:hypothetical protein